MNTLSRLIRKFRLVIILLILCLSTTSVLLLSLARQTQTHLHWLELQAQNPRFFADRIYRIEGMQLDSGLLESRANFRISLQSACRDEPTHLADAELTIKSTPWWSSVLELHIRPNPVFVRTSPEHDYTWIIHGRLTHSGTLELHSEVQDLKVFVQGPYLSSSGENWEFSAPGKLSINVTSSSGEPEIKWNLSTQEIKINTNSSQISAEAVNVQFESTRDRLGNFRLTSNKVEMPKALLISPELKGNFEPEVDHGGLVHTQLTTEKSLLDGRAHTQTKILMHWSLKDWANSLTTAQSMLAACPINTMQPEAKLNARLALHEILKSGVAITLEDLSTQTEAGPLRAAATIGLMGRLDNMECNVHSALSIRGKVMLPDGLLESQSIQAAVDQGALFKNNQGAFLGAFQYEKQQLTLNQQAYTGGALGAMGFIHPESIKGWMNRSFCEERAAPLALTANLFRRN